MAQPSNSPVPPRLETNVIYCADNLQVMKQLPSESVDLIYVDPPFFSGKKYETIWGGKVEVVGWDTLHSVQRTSFDINAATCYSNEEYGC